MTSLILKPSLLFLPVFALLNLLAVALGVTRPPNPALAGFVTGCEGQAQPCWYGIVPGVTTAQEVFQLLAFAGEPELGRSITSTDDYRLIFRLPAPSPYCRVTLEFIKDVVIQGEISLCRPSDIRLGDLALFMEQEEKTLSLPPHELVYGLVSVNVVGWLAPNSRVGSINLLSPGLRFQHFPWLGFVSQRRYCQLVPNYPRCG